MAPIETTDPITVAMDHPANAGVLAYLESRSAGSLSGAAGIPSCSPTHLDDPYYGLGTHPDLITHLWDDLTVELPAPCAWVVWGAPALVRPDNGILFGFAHGVYLHVLRLPAADHEPYLRAARAQAESFAQEQGLEGDQRERYLAIHSGPIWEYSDGSQFDVRDLGPDWVIGRSLDKEPRWCLRAYEGI